MRPNNKSFEGFSIPFAGPSNLLCERFDFGDSVESGVRRDDESPFTSEGFDDVRKHGMELFGVGIESVEMKPCFVLCVWENVFFEGIIT